MNGLSSVLRGVNVVAVAANIPAPLAAARLRSLGAQVVKVEPPHGDALEGAAPAWYARITEGIEVERLDLRDAGDRGRLAQRLGSADVLLTAMRAGAMVRAGIDWATLHARHPRLSQIAVVGEAAPHGDRAGHDLTYQARAGLLDPPAMPRTVLADLAAAERVVSAALAALLAAARTGDGVFAEVAIVDAAYALAAPLRYGLTAREGSLGGALPTYRLYRAKTGWVALAALEPHFVERLRALLGIDALDEPALAAAFATRSSLEWERLAGERDVPLAAVAEHVEHVE